MIKDDGLASSTNETKSCLEIRKVRFLVLLTTCLFFANSVLGQRATAIEGNAVIPVVDFCDLVQNWQTYDQKTIRVKAVYRYGQYWNELFCPGCNRDDRISFEISADFETKTPKKFRKRIKHSDRGRTLNVVVVGKFFGTGNFGHRGALRFALIVDAIEDAQIILEDSPYLLPDDLTAKAICKCGAQLDDR